MANLWRWQAIRILSTVISWVGKGALFMEEVCHRTGRSPATPTLGNVLTKIWNIEILIKDFRCCAFVCSELLFSSSRQGEAGIESLIVIFVWLASSSALEKGITQRAFSTQHWLFKQFHGYFNYYRESGTSLASIPVIECSFMRRNGTKIRPQRRWSTRLFWMQCKRSR